jgi:hypothetical protein
MELAEHKFLSRLVVADVSVVFMYIAFRFVLCNGINGCVSYLDVFVIIIVAALENTKCGQTVKKADTQRRPCWVVRTLI